MMAQMCEFYGLDDIELKCELFFTNTEKEKVNKLCEGLDRSFITIEPHSKDNYTPNRAYPFEKWQNIVNELSNEIQVVQIGTHQSKLLDNVVDMRGLTSFREAAILIGKSKLFMSAEGGLTHAATTTDTPALTIITGYQHADMVAYPQNINIVISNHGPCGLKIKCEDCEREALEHNEKEIIDKVVEFLI
jgi:ADP-heptose:LPS heptosyltransferase